MSSPFTYLYNFTVPNALHLLGILIVALVLIRAIRGAANRLIQPAASQARAAQLREQQTRALAELAYGVGSKIVWMGALLTALPEFGISIVPGVVLGGLGLLGVGFGAQNLVRDVVAGFCIVLEDQYAAGDTIQAGETLGRVEQVTLRRTVVRDARGALVTLANGEMRTASNLSRDWSQAFVDISVGAETAVEKSLQALEAAAAELRGDASWAQTLVDGPRVLGVQGYERGACTLRLQVRTAPTRQDEVCRELRRRVQMELQRRGIPLASAREAVQS